MYIDLRKVFAPIADTTPETIDMVICDTYETLLSHDGKVLNEPLHDFLLWLKEHGVQVILASQKPKIAEIDLMNAGCSPLLLEGGVRDKLQLQYELDAQSNYVVFDDEMMIWLDAPAHIFPNREHLQHYIGQGAYKNLDAHIA